VLAQTTDPDKLSVFAAQRSDSALTVIVINKTTGSLTSQVSLANFSPDKAAKVFRYSGAHLSGIAAQPDQAVASNGFSATFPAYSITLFVIPQSPASLPVPKPDVAAVVNAASYGKAISPGQIVTIFGSNLGPSTLQGLALDSNGLVAASLAGAQVLFDGAPAPLVYVSANQLSAIVPYTAAVAPSTHVQVQYQGVRSDALEVPVVEAAPGIFTNDASGTGQGAILNQDGSRNSAANPAARGSVISIYMTGEGQTDPPGFDGKVAGPVLPAPLSSVAVLIGGLPATLRYAGAAPGEVAGVMQVNAQVPQEVAPGSAVSVVVTAGSASSQTGVTLAVK